MSRGHRDPLPGRTACASSSSAIARDSTGPAYSRKRWRRWIDADPASGELTLSLGDLIEGNTEDQTQIKTEWKEVNGAIDQLHTPFFYVPGNHDLTNDVQRQIWRAKLGADYYHFRYKGALFIILNTEDPPQPKIARKKLLEAYGAEAMGKVMGALQGDAAQAEALFAREPKLGELATKLRASESVAISTAQIEMVRRALADNPRPRWTFVLMHRPAWKVTSPAFERIEAMLKGRPYTMLAGHFHKYAYERRKEQDYIQLGVTGGMPGAKADDPAAQDHIMWVSLADGAPQISNIRLDGFFDKQGPSPK